MVQGLRDVAELSLARVGQLERARAPLEELHAKLFLQLMNVEAHRGTSPSGRLAGALAAALRDLAGHVRALVTPGQRAATH